MDCNSINHLSFLRILVLVGRGPEDSVEVDGVVGGDSPEQQGTKLRVALGALVRMGVDAVLKVIVN